MRVTTLEATPFDDVCRVFDRAFADYPVPFPPAESFLAEMMRRRGVRLELSVGVADGGELVGFTLNGLGPWRGALGGYDCGTGVVPAYRGRRLTALMLERTFVLLRTAGATRYVLEALDSNERAIRAYRGAGFAVARELTCWTLEAPARAAPAGVAVVEEPGFDATAMAALRDVEPSWQNGDASIARAGAPSVTLAVRDAAGLAGCAVLFPGASDLAQLAVAPRARRRGVGRALLVAARERCARGLRVLNVDARDAGCEAFLRAVGARPTVRQLEMERAI